MEKKAKFKFNKKKVSIFLIILIIFISGGAYFSKEKKDSYIKVDTAKVSKKKIVQTASATGNIEANYRNEIALNPAQKVGKVLVKEGQAVKKGDIVVELDSSDFKNQLEKQKINLENANNILNQLQGTSIVNEKNNAKNSVSQSEIALQNAKNNYDVVNKKYLQTKTLFQQGHVSKNEFEAAGKSLTDAENAIKTAQLSLNNAKNSLSNLDVNNNNKIVNQRNQIALIKTDIASLQDKIEQCNIKTDVDGKVVKNNAKENQYPKAGDSIIIDDTSKYKLSLDVSQYDAVNIKKGQKAAIKIKGIDKIYSGVVTDIGNIAQAKINTTGGDQEFKVNVKVTFDNADALIKAGYEGSADIVLNEKPSSIAIGFDGVKEDRAAKKKYVYVVDGNKVSKKYIKTGLESEYDVEVLEGLEEGEIYVINPPEKLKEGDLVSLKK
jgi:HlyD family secretion protein